MIENIKYIVTKNTNPYKNLALEEYLLDNVGDKECILYLWQNENTVVIGRNQNPWKECNVTKLEKEDGHLVRRLSGGGAVYHDLGNLNFTFLVDKGNYNVDKQVDVILKAVNSLGIPAKKDGRNDITVDGKKFSGNAFYVGEKRCYHHGTLLIDVDINKLSRYLNVSEKKLASKGVASVRSRVCNLKDYNKDLTIQTMIDELIIAFGQVYGLNPLQLDLQGVADDEVRERTKKFSSWDWRFGRKLDFNYSLEKRFTWGQVEMKFYVSSGIIKEAVIFTDALEIQPFIQMSEALKGCAFNVADMKKTLEELELLQEAETLKVDIISMLKEMNL